MKKMFSFVFIHRINHVSSFSAYDVKKLINEIQYHVCQLVILKTIREKHYVSRLMIEMSINIIFLTYSQRNFYEISLFRELCYDEDTYYFETFDTLRCVSFLEVLQSLQKLRP